MRIARQTVRRQRGNLAGSGLDIETEMLGDGAGALEHKLLWFTLLMVVTTSVVDFPWNG